MSELPKTIEKLTDNEREFVASWDDPVGAKALRIIDAQSAALDQLLGPALDAATQDAAALAKQAVFYRDLATEWKATAEGYHEDAVVAKDKLAALLARNSAAIEAIESAQLVSGSCGAAWAKQALQALREDGPNERAASIELKQLSDKCDAQAAVIARVRAELGETDDHYYEMDPSDPPRRLQAIHLTLAAAPEHTESLRQQEVAALRAEVERLRGAVSAYEALTADLEPLDMLVHWRSDRDCLAAAIALLERVAALDTSSLPMVVVYLVADTLRFLSLATAPSERAAAERKVLEATEQVPDGTLKWLVGDGMSSSLREWATVLLALRAVTK